MFYNIKTFFILRVTFQKQTGLVSLIDSIFKDTFIFISCKVVIYLHKKWNSHVFIQSNQ